MPLVFRYAARSDVGLVRSGNEDSGYASDTLLIVADGAKVWVYEPDLEQATVRNQGEEEQNSPLTALINPAQLDRQYDVSEEAAPRDGMQWLSLSPKRETEASFQYAALGFGPAGLARMEVVPYLPLSKETLATIIAGKLARLDNVLRSRFGADVIIGPEVTDEIMSRVTRAENGARMLESVIDGDMLPPLSLLLLQKMAANTAIARIRLSAADGAFTADVEDALPDDAVTPQTEDETVL